VRLRTLAAFGVGYVLGTRAGHERYAQIVALAQRTSRRLEDYSERHRAEADDAGIDASDGGPRRRAAAL
jgi:hypothetical protein